MPFCEIGQSVLEAISHCWLRFGQKLIFQTDNGLVGGQVAFTAISGMWEALKEAVNGRISQCRAEGVQHGCQFNLADAPILVCIILLEHRSPKLLPQGWVGHVFGPQSKHWIMLRFPLLQILHLQGHIEQYKVRIFAICSRLYRRPSSGLIDRRQKSRARNR